MKNLTKSGLLAALAVGAFLMPSCKKDAKTNSNLNQPSPQTSNARPQKIQSLDGNLLASWPLIYGTSPGGYGTGQSTEDAGPNNHVLSFGPYITGATDRYGNANAAVYIPVTGTYPDGFSTTSYYPNDLRLSGTDFTLNIWIKLDSYNTGNDSRIMDKRYPATDGWYFSVSGDTFSAGHGHLLFSNCSSTAYSTGTVSLNTWHMVSTVYLYSANEILFYIDGVLSGTTTGIASPSSTSNSNVHFGFDQLATPNNAAFIGAMDDARIYSVAFNAADLGVLYNAPNPTGLLAYWSLDNNADDLSGNHFFGTPYNTLAVGDRFGNANSAYNFNGTSSYITAPDLAAFGNLRLNNTDFTLNAWVKVPTLGSAMQIMAKRSSTAGGWGWSITTSGYDFFGPGGGMTSSTGTTAITAGSWHMVTVTYQYSTGLLTHYVDGVAAGSYSGVFPTPTSVTNGLVIGRDDLGPNYFFNGNLDDIRIYNKALTSTEINTIKNTQF
ncbi:LamG domain-containing protein [Mucilaginibacter panaciglaebae]|uniref:LamG-like jellyroll fold domain-containing protein n=1 Tax=Mucilaginibacter panaciglaebae TaxID=502331 RepID=A0ABP7WVK0_9SPHI